MRSPPANSINVLYITDNLIILYQLQKLLEWIASILNGENSAHCCTPTFRTAVLS